jgi:hypothetical protein
MAFRPLYEIAKEIRNDWQKVNFAAQPYLWAMAELNDIRDQYYLDSGVSVVSYFLATAQGWRGDKAKAIKAELKSMVQSARLRG